MLASTLAHSHVSEPCIQWVLSLSNFNQLPQKTRGRHRLLGAHVSQLHFGSSADSFGGFNSKVIPAFAYLWTMLCLPRHQRRVFETVRNINQVVKQRSLTPSPMNIPGSNQSSAVNSLLSSCVSTPRSSFYGSDVGNVVLDNKTNSIILEAESADLG